MKQLIVMDRSGDTRINLTDEIKVAEAMDRFQELVGGKKYVAVAENADGSKEVTRTFDANRTITLHAPFVGG